MNIIVEPITYTQECIADCDCNDCEGIFFGKG